MGLIFIILFICGSSRVDAFDNILRNKSDTNIGTFLTDGMGSVTCVSVNLSLNVNYRLEKNFSSTIIKVHFKEPHNASLTIYINGFYSWYQPTDTTEVIIVGQRTLETIRLNFDSTEPIEVCEIEMMGCEKNYFGDGCTPCDLPVNCEVCDVLTGSCYRCLSNLTGPDCVQENKNIILGNIPDGLSPWYLYYNEKKLYEIDGFLLTDGLINKSNCQSFAELPLRIHIWAGFNRLFYIGMLKFYMLFDNIPDAENVILQFDVSGSSHKWHGNFSVSVDGTYSLPYTKYSGYIFIQIAFVYTNVSWSSKAYVCELEVNGCPSESYGTPCRKCNSGCTHSMCDQWDGSCICAASYPDFFCPQGALCRHGLYGKYCDQNCSSHCNTSFECHQVNGTCIGGCQDGWGSDKCDKGRKSLWVYIF